jgi:hypothetical protein
MLANAMNGEASSAGASGSPSRMASAQGSNGTSPRRSGSSTSRSHHVSTPSRPLLGPDAGGRQQAPEQDRVPDRPRTEVEGHRLRPGTVLRWTGGRGLQQCGDRRGRARVDQTSVGSLRSLSVAGHERHVAPVARAEGTATPGERQLEVRATDRSGALQHAEHAPPIPRTGRNRLPRHLRAASSEPLPPRSVGSLRRSRCRPRDPGGSVGSV